MKYNVSLGTVDGTVIPVTLATAKANSNIEHSDSEAFLQLVLDASISEAESYVDRAIRKKTSVIYLDKFKKQMILPYGPIVSISSVKYWDEAGVEITIDPSQYGMVPYENGQSAILFFKWEYAPVVNEYNPYPITVNVVAGYADANAIPADIKKAILLIFSQHELYREDMPIKLDRSSRALLRPYRKY